MSDKEAQPETIRVIDKRRQGRTEDSSSESALGEKVQTSASKQTSEKTSEADSSSKQSESQGGYEVDFSAFVIGLAHQTLMMLGDAPHPETNQMMVNLDGAKHTIDILGILQEKTKGNLTSDEQKLLTDIVTNLRLAFVAKTKNR